MAAGAQLKMVSAGTVRAKTRTAGSAGEIVDRAIVLRMADAGESDRLVTLLTENHGKVVATAKAARASRERFGLALDLYHPVMAGWRPSKRGRVLLLRVAGLAEGPAPVLSLERLSTISLWCDFADRFTPPEVPVPELFSTLLRGIALISSREFDPALVRPVVTMKLLDREGLAPDFSRCIQCGRGLQKTAWKFSRAARGPVCGFCTPVTREDRVSPAEISTFDYLKRTPPARWSRLKTRPGILASLDRFSLDLLEETAGARLPAARFLGWEPPPGS